MLVHNNRLMVRCDCDGACDCAAGTGAPASAVQPAAWTQQAFVGQPLLRRALCLAVQDRVQVLVRRISTTHRVELHDIYLRTVRCVVPRNRPARLRIAFTICIVPDSILCKFKNDSDIFNGKTIIAAAAVHHQNAHDNYIRLLRLDHEMALQQQRDVCARDYSREDAVAGFVLCLPLQLPALPPTAASAAVAPTTSQTMMRPVLSSLSVPFGRTSAPGCPP
jgi:hypothetical protein